MIDSRRRWIGRGIKLGLVAVGIALVFAWVQRKSPVRADLELQSEPVAEEALAPGDVRISDRDSAITLTLQGDRILAGLSPKTIEKVRRELEESSADDTSSVGGSIARMVKRTVAGSIGSQVAYPLSDIRDMSYRAEDERIVIIRHDGRTTELFGSVKTDGRSIRFARADAERFAQAVRARKQSLPQR